MIGKTKALRFTSLFFVILFSLLVISFIFRSFQIITIFLIFSLVSLVITKYGLKINEKLNLLQSIRDDGPSHHLSKKNTPTMGGVFIVSPLLLLLLIVNNRLDSIGISLLLFCTLSFFIIGFFDDYLSIIKKRNIGFKSNEKFILQTCIAIIFILIASKYNYINPSIAISNNWSIDTNILIFPICFFTLVGLSNAVNLTDGLDGLASGCSSIVFFGLGTEIFIKNQPELIIYGLISYAVSGLCIGFLKYNKHPAKIFMGDTGSLTIGATLGSISILTNSLFTLYIISGIFIIEALSVMIQVSYFKITKKIFKSGKRVFLMTPIHHHYELKGIKEEKIVENFWKVNILLVVLGIVLKINL
ncbi:phospho-N-acetylmuramoyl-pentapeptide-transferase [Prochlorococcus sp. AH-716-O13]|nr:phospho-N-acetylmuramoyl-pentapeptide-transferase [Prochlorococcus sp. AH-716-O13]